MSLHSDFFPNALGDDLVPGDIIDTPSNYIADGVNYIDITDGVIVDKSLFPALSSNLHVSDYTNNILEQTISNPGVDSPSGFASSIAYDAGTLVVAAGGNDYNSVNNSGEAYVYVKDTNGDYILQQLLPPGTPISSGLLGYYGVALQGDTCILPEPALSGPGKAYIYTRSGTTWSLTQTLTNPGTTPNGMGRSIEMAGNILAIGTENTISGIGNAGSVLIFEKIGSTWEFQYEIGNPNPINTSDLFGWKISLDANFLMVGEIYDDTTVSNAGQAHVYKNIAGVYTLHQTINNPVPGPDTDDYFGSDVSHYGNVMVIGAKNDGPTGTNQGAAFIYENIDDVWTLQQTIDGEAGNTGFGEGVYVYEDVIFINDSSDIGGSFEGRVYVYKRTSPTGGWDLIETIDSPLTASSQEFGQEIIATNSEIFITARGTNVTGNLHYYSVGNANTFYIQGQDQVLKVK
jgi:hypothetical protein